MQLPSLGLAEWNLMSETQREKKKKEEVKRKNFSTRATRRVEQNEDKVIILSEIAVCQASAVSRARIFHDAQQMYTKSTTVVYSCLRSRDTASCSARRRITPYRYKCQVYTVPTALHLDKRCETRSSLDAQIPDIRILNCN